MAKVLKAQEIEAEVEEDSGYFYQRLGELRFTPESDLSSHGSQKGYEQRLAVASRHGVAVFADHRGVYIARVHNLLAAATKSEEDQELPPANADEVCLYTMSLADASVALSCDEELLAAWDHQQISVWSLGGLVDRRDTQPLTNWLVPGGIAVKQLAWRPAQAPGTVPEAAVVTVKGQLLRGSLGGSLQPLPDLAEGRVACVAWSADGSLLALASANCVTVQHLKSGRHFRTEFDSKEAKDAEGVVTVENLTWSGPYSLLVSAIVHPVEALEDEMDIAPLAVVQWASWDVQAGADPEKLQLIEFIAPGINPHAAAWDSGPYSRTILVPAWGAIVVAHRKASDDHIRLYELGPSGAAKAIDVTEDWSAIRIPTAMDYNDNYVTGLGIDLTSTDVEVQPPDPEASALAPSPVLLVATSDGALRFFTFAHMSKPTEGLVAPAVPFSDALPPMAPDEQEDLSTATTQKAEKRALAVPLPLDDEEDEEGDREESEAERGEPAAAAPSSMPVKAREAQAAATALPASSDEDDSSSSERGEETSSSSSSSSAVAARAAKAALPSDESDLEDDADSRVTRDASSEAGERPSISRLDISEHAKEDDDIAENRAPFGPISGRKLDFGGETAKAASEARQPSVPAPSGQKQAGLPGFSWGSAAPPSTSATSNSPAPFSSAPNSFSFGSMPAFSTASAGAFDLSKLGASDAAAIPGTAALNIPKTEAGSTPSMFGSSSSPFGTAASAPFQSASSNIAKSQDSKGFLSLPPQSAQQKAITKAREAAATKAAAALAPPPPQAPPSAAPQSKPLAVSEHNGAPVPGIAAQRNSQQEHAVTSVRQKPPEPVARLKGESKELAAMEEDFLKTLAETRELEQAFSAAMAKSEGDSASGPGTHQGFHALQKRTNALTRSVADILLSLTTERRRFGELHNGWREDRARAEALLYFNGKHTNGASTNGSVDDSEVLDPALQELVTLIDSQLEALQKQMTQLNDCLKALEERASTRLPGASIASRASAQQLYNAVNAQSAVATAQLERLEMLWQKLHDMGISEDDDGEESGSGGPPSFPYLSALSASRPFPPAGDSPTDSSRRTWKQVRKSPLGRPKSRRPAPLSPLSSAAGPVDSPWASASAGSLRRLLLDKVSVDGGGVRLTRVGGTVFPRLPKPDGGEEDWSSTTKGVITDEQASAVQPAKSASLASPFGSSAQVDAGAAASRPSTQPLKFGQSAGLERAGSSAIALDKIQPQAAPLHQRDGRDATHRPRQPSMLSATSAPETKGKLARKESTASADSSGSTPNAAPRPKHARPSSTQDLPQGPSMGSFKPFQRQASGSGLARAGSAALGFAEPANSSDSGAESTNKGPAHRTAPPSMQATIPEDAGPAPSAAKMPPVPSKAALAQAQAHAQAALQKVAPAPSAKMPPVPSRAAVEAAQAQGQAALRISGAAPAAKTPPIPDKAAVAAAQAKGQAALQQSAQTPPAAKVPPVPSKAAMAAAQAQGQAALKKTAPAPAAKMSPLPSKAAMAAAHQQAQAALQKSTPAAPSAQTAAAMAPSPSPFAIPSASATPAASQAQPVFNFAKLSSGDAASPTASTSATQPFAFTTQQSAAFSFASAMSSSTSAEAATAQSSAAGQSAFLFQSAQPSTAATSSPFQAASSPAAASQPFLGSFGMSAPLSSAPQPIAPAPATSISFGAASAAALGSTASPAAPPAAFSGFAQSAANPSSPSTATFGSQAPSPSTSAFGTLSFGTSASQQMSSPSALASGFGSFGGLGQSTPASASAGSPFNKGISFGTPATPPAPSLFGGFGQPSSDGTANAFAGFSQSASAFGQPQAPMSSAAPSSGAFSGGFGQSTGFGQAQGSGFGQPSPLGTGFGQPAKPGFGQVGSPGFGAPAVPGFGAPATPTFGSPAAPAPPFGAATGSNAFGAAAAQGSGFGAFASMAGQPSPFGVAAQSGGGFAAAAQQSGGFGGFGGSSSFGAPAASSPAASPGNSDLWQMRK